MLILNQLLQSIQKLYINYLRLEDRPKKYVLIALYKVIQKANSFKRKKKVKLTKRAHAFKGCTSTYNVAILNPFNPELQLKDTKHAIKSKLIELLTQLKVSNLWQHYF